jgi:uncharacterized protein GlcG (DUF336 family)
MTQPHSPPLALAFTPSNAQTPFDFSHSFPYSSPSLSSLQLTSKMASLTTQKETLTLAGAKIAIAAAEDQARKMGLHMNIAVVDASTHLLHFSRMPNAKITSISIAIDKAFTAAGHRQGTHLYKDAVWPGGVAFGYVLFSHLSFVGSFGGF